MMVPPLYGRLIARWRHGIWCHRYGKGSCFNSTRGHTGSLLVFTKGNYLGLSPGDRNGEVTLLVR